MNTIPVYVALLAYTCVLGVSAVAEPVYPSYFYPVEHRSNFYPVERRSDLRSFQEESVDPADYEFQIVPRDEYEVAELVNDDSPFVSLSLWDLLPSPVASVISVGKLIVSKALALIKLVISKAVWIALGAGIVLGVCAFTPFCTLTIERPLINEYRSISQNIPYIDEIENAFYQAYDKIHAMYGQH